MEKNIEAKAKAMRTGGKILHKILREAALEIHPGTNVLQVEAHVDSLFKKYNVKPSFKGYQGFPSSICLSVNDEVVHGIPKDRVLEQGDIISLDSGVYFDGFHTDSAITVPVGDRALIDSNVLFLIEAAEEALQKSIKVVKAGIRVGEISHTIGSFLRKKGLRPAEDLGGHGISKTVHEDPYIANEGPNNYGMTLKEGMTIAIEPIVTDGNGKIMTGDDGWTIVTKDGAWVSHFEHTLLVLKNGCEVLT